MGDHTETVQMEFDPSVTSYGAMLDLFWLNHDPTMCHKRQYMSAIFYHDPEQKKAAEAAFEAEQKKRGTKLATKIEPAERFYDAEGYHQKYLLQQNSRICDSLSVGSKKLITSHVAARINGYVGGYGTKQAFEKEWSQLGLTEQQAEAVRPLVGRRA